MTTAAGEQSFLRAVNTGHPGIVTNPNQASVAKGVAALEKTVAVTKIRARNASCDCPHCGAELDGWCVDPRGRDTTCDDCKLAFTIAADAVVSIT